MWQGIRMQGSRGKARRYRTLRPGCEEAIFVSVRFFNETCKHGLKGSFPGFTLALMIHLFPTTLYIQSLVRRTDVDENECPGVGELSHHDGSRAVPRCLACISMPGTGGSLPYLTCILPRVAWGLNMNRRSLNPPGWELRLRGPYEHTRACALLQATHFAQPVPFLLSSAGSGPEKGPCLGHGAGPVGNLDWRPRNSSGCATPRLFRGRGLGMLCVPFGV